MTPWRRLSLSRRLLIGLLVVSFSYWAIIAWLTIRDTIDETYRLFDAHLAQTAIALMRVTDPDETDPTGVMESRDRPTIAEVFPNWKSLPDRLADYKAMFRKPATGGTAEEASSASLYAEYERRMRYQIWDSRGTLLLRSANAPDTMITTIEGFSEEVDSNAEVWRHYAVWDQHRDFHIIVSEAHDIRYRLVRRIATHLVSPLVFGLPVLALLLWLSIRHGLDPLAHLTDQIAQRQPGNLDPLDATNAPAEVRPAMEATNALLRRIAQTLENERLFTANAAHELRTPLAAIQAHLHAAQTAPDEDARRLAMAQVQSGVERGIRLVGQLLTLARLDPEQSLQDVEELDLGAEAELVCAQLGALALARNQVLELDVTPGTPSAHGNADMVSMLLGNLLDNAIRYSPPGAHIRIAVRADAGVPLIEVIDDGPGIPPDQRDRVFERFYRIAGQDQPGTGLGLAICRRIAELHSATLTLDAGPDGKGLAAALRFPGEEAPPPIADAWTAPE